MRLRGKVAIQGQNLGWRIRNVAFLCQVCAMPHIKTVLLCDENYSPPFSTA